MKHSQWQKVWTSWGDCFSFFSASYDVRIHCIAWHETFSNSRHFSHCNVPFESHLSNQAHVLIQCTDDWHTSQIQCFHYTNQNVTCMLQLLSKHTHTHQPIFYAMSESKVCPKIENSNSNFGNGICLFRCYFVNVGRFHGRGMMPLKISL